MYEIRNLKWKKVQLEDGSIVLSASNRFVKFDIEIISKKQVVLYWIFSDQRVGDHCEFGSIVEAKQNAWEMWHEAIENLLKKSRI